MATLTNFDSYMHVLHEMSILTPQRPLDPAVCGAFADWLGEDGAEWLAVDPSLASDLRAGRCRFPWIDVNGERKVRGYVVVVNVDGSAGSVRAVSKRAGWSNEMVEMSRDHARILYGQPPFTFVDESGREFNASFAIPPGMRMEFETAPGRLEASWGEPPQNVQGAISNLRERLAQIGVVSVPLDQVDQEAVRRAREGGRLIRQEYYRRHGIDIATLFRPDAPAQPDLPPATEDDSEGGSPD